MMQTDLATLLDIGKVTLGGLVDRLEIGGWVERRADPYDRRVKRVFLTATAHDLIRDMRASEQRHNRSVLKGLSRDDRAQLADLLGRIKKNLRPA
jgi:DNA-binding MarR family transcriptional regulator